MKITSALKTTMWLLVVGVIRATEGDCQTLIDEPAAKSEPTPLGNPSNWRQVLHSEFAFKPSDDIPAAVVEDFGRSSDAEMLILEPMVVRHRKIGPDFRDFEKALRAQATFGSADEAMERLGVGAHRFMFKKLPVSYTTIFYLPVSLKVSF